MNRNFIRGIKIDFADISENSYLQKMEGLKKLHTLDFHKSITFFTGENGTGKSTLLEGIAVGLGFNSEGGSRNFRFSTHDNYSELHDHLKIVRGVRRPTDDFFLRAESFYNLATYAEEIGLDFAGSLHEKSHGESFLHILHNRFRGNGLYLLDEPEAAFSLQRQLTLMAKIHQLAKNGSQFIIATHSPFLLAIPNSQIISFDNGTVTEITYEESSPYQIMSLFFHHRETMLEELFRED